MLPKTNLSSMKQIGQMSMPQLHKAPKHRKAMLRNMCCSLIKFERIETTYGKGKALSLWMKNVFDIYNNSTIDEATKKQQIVRILQNEGAYNKLKTNLIRKLQGYKGHELIFRYNRIRINGYHNMYIVEFAKNPKKRLEEKRNAYFSELTGNSYLDFCINLKNQRLYDLLNQHLLLSSLLKQNFNDIEKELKEKKEISLNFALNVVEKNYEKVDESLQIPEIKTLLLNQVLKKEYSMKDIKTGRDYLLLHQYHMSILNQEINQIKVSLKDLQEISKDERRKFNFDLHYYKKYYSEEYERYKKVFERVNRELKIQKQPIRDSLKEIRKSEDQRKRYLLKYAKKASKFIDELDFYRPSQKRVISEYEKTNTSKYISGDESGFSDLDDIHNKPIEIVKLRNEINNFRNKPTQGRRVERHYNRYI